MKALLSKTAGDASTLVLEEVAPPKAGPGQVVISVKAAGINFPDALVIQDLYQIRPPRPFAPGMEVAGTVLSVGAGVTRVNPGERVLGIPGWGGCAEQVAVPEANCMRLPSAMSFDDASVLVATYGTSHYALHDRANIQSGEVLLVLGAAGGVGAAAVELGKAAGAKVIAMASSEDKVAFARACGADAGLVYPRGPLDKTQQKDLADAIKAACKSIGVEGVDVVMDAVGGDYAEPALRAINWYGRYLVVGFTAGIPKMPLNLVLLKSCQVVGVLWGAWAAREPEALHTHVEELMKLYLIERIKPRISKRFPLERGGEAIKEVADRKVMGKIVVTVDS